MISYTPQGDLQPSILHLSPQCSGRPVKKEYKHPHSQCTAACYCLYKSHEPGLGTVAKSQTPFYIDCLENGRPLTDQIMALRLKQLPSSGVYSEIFSR